MKFKEQYKNMAEFKKSRAAWGLLIKTVESITADENIQLRIINELVLDMCHQCWDNDEDCIACWDI